MDTWRQRLDGFVADTVPVPPHAQALRIPRIDGWEHGRVWCTWTIDPVLIQPQGAVFGGAISAVADEMVGMATLTVLADDEVFVTSDVRVSFFRAVRGGEVSVEATVVHRGRTTVFVEATFTLPDGVLAAKATATQIVRRPKAGS